MTANTFSRIGPTPEIAPGCTRAEGVMVVLCECGCNHFRIFLTGRGDRAFAIAGLTVDQAEGIAKKMLADVEVARSSQQHGGIGHA